MNSPSPVAIAAPPIAVLVAIAALQPVGINMFMPAIPAMRIDLDTDTTTVQLAISLYLAATAVGMLVHGPLSDRYGRRPVLLVGLVLYILGSLVCVFAPTIEVLLVARVVQAFGSSAGMTLSRAIVRDCFDRERSASMIGYVTMGMAIAPAISPGIGGVLSEIFDWRATFAAMCVFGVGTFVFALISLHETNPRAGTPIRVGAMLRSFGSLLAIPAFWKFSGTAALASAVFFAFIGGAPHIAPTVLGISPAVYGAYSALLSIGYIIGNFLSGRYAARVGIPRMIHLGNLIAFAALPLMGLAAVLGANQPIWFFGAMVLVSIGNGVCLPSAIAGAVSVRPDLAGAASGLTGAFHISLAAATTVLVGALLDAGLWPGTVWPVLAPMLVAGALAVLVGQFVRGDGR
ncbi:multidrug effflux MFS transporter [Pseudoxanthobacter sp. M-2]|uniref:multidrug effflux MFS transporter n=1 Tax=Pseudoxanthobacter sp. M-2 TaxID=3078754 RepID=UPI0038FC9FBA